MNGDSTSRGRVFVVGSLNLDTVYRVQVAPRGGETIAADTVQTAVGGKGGNQAVAAARAGAEVIMVGKVGTDQAATAILAALSDAGANVEHVSRTEMHPSGTATVIVDATGENRIVIGAGANRALAAEDVRAALASCTRGDLVVLQNEIDPATTRAAADFARERGATVLWNAAPAPHFLGEVPAGIDLMVINEHELAAIARLVGVSAPTLDGLVDRLAEATGSAVICTVGADGAWFRTGSDAGHVPAQRVRAVDTTAAGDTFVGYLAAQITSDRASLPARIAFAAMAASVTVTRSGASPSIPTLDEVVRPRPDETQEV